MNIALLLQRSSRAFPAKRAVMRGKDTLFNYAELAERVTVIAANLRRRYAMRAGERVALAMGNAPEYIELLFAGWYAGLTMVPINAKLHPREFDYIIGHSAARLCFVSPALTDAIAPLQTSLATLDRVISVGSRDYADLARGAATAMSPEFCSPDDIAWLFYTSGTTGWPKGAMLSHANLLAATQAYLTDVDGIAPDDCILHAAPMSHGSGLYILPHIARGAANVVPPSGGFDAAEIFALLAELPGLTMFLAPTMVKRLCQHPDAPHGDVVNLKTIVYGGGPMYRADLERAHQVFGYKLAQIYGQGESPMTITALDKFQHAAVGQPRYRERLGSAGLPYLGIAVRIARPDDPDDAPLPPGEIGEVLVSGATVMRGYWQDPEATAAALRNGWLHTGDIGSLDEDGFLTLSDRSKDLIISGGSNIYPREIEEALLRHPGVREVAVVGAPDADWGERVVAFVVAERDADASVLDAFCIEQIARFKRPKDYYFVEALPKNNYGKVVKTELRKRLVSSPPH